MRAAPLLLVLALLAAGCARPTELGEPEQASEATQRLEFDSYYQANFDVPTRSHVRITVNVTSGGPIDVWLASGVSCGDWLQPSFQPAATLFGVTNGTLELDVPAGSVCLPLDNADIAPGPTSPQGDVVVQYRIETWRI